jgi:RNA polymerase sigma-70 factor (ECF subfamily)
MRDMTLSNVDRLIQLDDVVGAAEADDIFQMDEDAFRVFYDRTARPVWAYLSRLTGDPRLADDLLQETYYRFLRARGTPSDDAHRRNYLFRIATNLVHDARRRPRVDAVPMPEHLDHPDPRHADHAGGAESRVDLSRAMARLKPRERALLWLAYAQGSSHKEIAETLGLKTPSIKLLLFRARRRLAALLGEGGR